MKSMLLMIMLFCFACHPGHEQKVHDIEKPKKTASVDQEHFTPEQIGEDRDIVNTTSRKIFLLYNSVKDFIKKTDETGVHFATECMNCEPIQSYRDHLIFAKQLELSGDQTNYNKIQLNIPDTTNLVRRISYYGQHKHLHFKFSEGTGKISYLKQSCNDADLGEIFLQYKTGFIRITNVLNAGFFEFDLDKNGEPEQFILATRNCSQEIAILRIM